MITVYNKTDDIIEIIVRDASMRKVGTWKFNTADTELGAGILRHLQRKYGFSPEIKPNENVKGKEEKKKEDKSFLDMDADW